MGIQLMQAPMGSNETPGPMSLPPAFQRELFAAKWVKQGPAVKAAAEREWIGGTKFTADGWQVWKDPETEKPFTVELQSGQFILLHRDLVVQQGVNAICGNVGKQRLSQERQQVSSTPEGHAVTDPGVLGEEVLQKRLGSETGDWGEGDVSMNPVPGLDGSRLKKPTLKTASRRH